MKILLILQTKVRLYNLKALYIHYFEHESELSTYL